MSLSMTAIPFDVRRFGATYGPDLQAKAYQLISLLLVLLAILAAPLEARAQPLRPADAPYLLGPGDKLKITVFGEETLSGEFLVSSTGNVSMPLVGDLPATGRTLAQFQSDLTTKLADGYLKEPKVAAQVLTYRPFYILGEVNKPGEYPYSADLTVMKAVATAQGFTYRANTKRAYVRRAGSQREIPIPLNSNEMVGPGDTVRIGERFF
jgi:protein involved in polysaccharide export with SLBB domain